MTLPAPGPHEADEHDLAAHDHAHLLAISVGNTSTRLGVFHGRELARSVRLLNAAPQPLLEQLVHLAQALPRSGSHTSAAVIASVNDKIAQTIAEELQRRTSVAVVRLGRDLEIPIERALWPDATPGQDRLLNALGAFDALNQACVIVDAGTALTVDFVDGEGVFQGGAIAPGAGLMLRALHAHTAALPDVPLARPDLAQAFGKNTAESIRAGVFFMLRGGVRALVERYAEAYEAYPPVIATGGDAALLFEDDELIDRVVPDLTLRGVEAAWRRSMSAGDLEPDQP